MVARRIIPCLDILDRRVVKGVRFADHVDMGCAFERAAAYCDQGADELVFYDIAASAEGRTLDLSWVRQIARTLDIPFCVAGGIRSLDQAAACLENGADKISINSPALQRPQLITEIARAAGSQCVVVGVDSFFDGRAFRVKQFAGKPDAMRDSGRLTLEWICEAIDRGAGEITLNCMNQDGVRQGYDLPQLKAARAVCTVPLVASGGAGEASHFVDVFHAADVSGALAASVFHSGHLTIGAVKAALTGSGLEVRP